MRYPSASQYGLSEICGYSFTVKTDWPWEPPGPAANYGKAAAKCVELYERDGWYDFDSVMREHEISQRQYPSLRVAVDWFCSVLDAENCVFRVVEYPMAVNLKTWEVRPAKDYRDKKQDEIVIIPDVISASTDGRVIIRDWKCKKPPAVYPGDWPQMNMYALAASRLFGATEIVQQLCYCQVKDGVAQPKPQTRQLDAFSIDDLRETISVHLDNVLPTMTEPVRGEHCERLYCKLRTRDQVYCPAWAEKEAV